MPRPAASPIALDPTMEARLAPLRTAIAGWFAAGHRDLPWRRTRDPYAVWISEIMLQQTRVETVAPRFSRWMARFPSVPALAAAPLDDVLAEWAGLGYYARARNLHAAARVMVERHGGRVPERADEVLALPGVGRYTAGAILSIAFGQPAPLLDGNVERVLARIFRVGGDPRASAARERLWSLAAGLVGGGGDRAASAAMQYGDAAPPHEGAAVQHGAPSPSHINQGLMELGAVVCSPRRPACLACPVAPLCEARGAGEAEAYPAKGRATRVVDVTVVALALSRRGRLLLCRRPADGLWGGLFELPSGEPLPGEAPLDAARRVAEERLGLRLPPRALRPLPPPGDRFDHLLSHRRVTFHGFAAEAPGGAVRRTFYDAHRWVGPGSATTLGISRATARLLEAAAAAPPQTRPTRSKAHG